MKTLLYSLMLGALVLPVACNRSSTDNAGTSTDIQREEDRSLIDNQRNSSVTPSTDQSDIERQETSDVNAVDEMSPDDMERQEEEVQEATSGRPIGGASEGPSNRVGEDAIEVEEVE